MITVKINNRILELFGGIKELPISRHKLMQQYLLQDSGIGSTIADIDDRFSKMISLMQAGKHSEALEELSNLRYSFFSALTGLDFKTRAFACFLAKVDGKDWVDVSPEGLTKVVDMLSENGGTVGELEEHWESVKKKLTRNYELFSPDGSQMTLNTLTT